MVVCGAPTARTGRVMQPGKLSRALASLQGLSKKAAAAALRKSLPQAGVGALDYLTRPKMRGALGGPFNGQRERRRIFEDILYSFSPRAIVETGTFRGTTTDYMATLAAVPVFSVELDAHSWGFSRARFLLDRRITLSHGDSRSFLRWLVSSGRVDPTVPCFFYLDAHWNEDLPLVAELDFILGNFRSPLIMVDDFQVPFDQGYGFDTLAEVPFGLGMVAGALARHAVRRVFFPAAASSAETGARRGCLVLGNDESTQTLERIESLRKWDM